MNIFLFPKKLKEKIFKKNCSVELNSRKSFLFKSASCPTFKTKLHRHSISLMHIRSLKLANAEGFT